MLYQLSYTLSPTSTVAQRCDPERRDASSLSPPKRLRRPNPWHTKQTTKRPVDLPLVTICDVLSAGAPSI